MSKTVLERLVEDLDIKIFSDEYNLLSSTFDEKYLSTEYKMIDLEHHENIIQMNHNEISVQRVNI